MLNQKLKNKIAELEKQVSDANKKIKEQEGEIKLLQWKLNNPPKYKVGDKFGDLVVIGRDFNKPSLSNVITDATVVTLMMLHIASKMNTTDKLKEYVAKTFNTQWEYELVNINTGKKIKKKELEL
jgi:hypothetical protein